MDSSNIESVRIQESTQEVIIVVSRVAMAKKSTKYINSPKVLILINESRKAKTRYLLCTG